MSIILVRTCVLKSNLLVVNGGNVLCIIGGNIGWKDLVISININEQLIVNLFTVNSFAMWLIRLFRANEPLRMLIHYNRSEKTSIIQLSLNNRYFD